jgi:hypothetical protein
MEVRGEIVIPPGASVIRSTCALRRSASPWASNRFPAYCRWAGPLSRQRLRRWAESIEVNVNAARYGPAPSSTSERQSKLRGAGTNIGSVPGELEMLRQVLVDMGSFSDLPMHPRVGSSMRTREAQNKQWELTEKIGAAVNELLRRFAAVT